MPDKKTTALDAVTTPVTGDDLLSVVRGSEDTKNVALSDVLLAPSIVPAARATHSTTQLTTNSVVLVPDLNTTEYDTDNMHDEVTNNSRLTCQTDGLYLITACAVWAVANVGNAKVLQLYLNAAPTVIGEASMESAWFSQNAISIARLYPLVAGDYIRMAVYQNSGSDINLENSAWGVHLAMTWVG
jgi:hypothetical protein